MRRRWSGIELFAALQILLGALLFVPDIQPYRMFVRALPFVASLASLLFLFSRAPGVPISTSGVWLLASLVVIAANLLHSETHLTSGIAQVVFQISIAAPMFWAAWTVSTYSQLARILKIIFAASLASAALGILQVYHPDWFLPPEFSTLALQLNPDIVDALSYIGPDGHTIIRPPGLSDVPGGASVAGLITVLLGVAYLNREGVSRSV